MYVVSVGAEQLLTRRAAHDSANLQPASGGAASEAGCGGPHHGQLGAPSAGQLHPVGHSGWVPHDLGE